MTAAGRFTFPSQEAEWWIEATRLHSQWRNRAGLAPDFPIEPVVGTEGSQDVTTSGVNGQLTKRDEHS